MEKNQKNNIESTVLEKYHALTTLLIEKHLTIATMESCTGGLIGALLSDQEGASAVVSGGEFTYSNESKIAHGVPAEILRDHGVYSVETAAAMAETCRRNYGTDIGLGITGSIGTADPNNADSVPGEVFVGVTIRNHVTVRKTVLESGERWECRWRIADEAEAMIRQALNHC